jgi:CrcB protein
VNQSLRAFLAVFVGGLAGSALRFIIDVSVTEFAGEWWPYGILVVNLTGSFAMGYIVGHGFGSWPAWLRLGSTTGFLGSYTTLSAISLDVAVPIIRHGVAGVAVMLPYAIGSIILGVVAAVWGLRLGKRLAETSA